jgi:hypothetical protein
MDTKIEDLDLQTGDILLYHEKDFWFSRIVEYFTGSQFSHVAMVIKDPGFTEPPLKGLYIFESGEEAIPDSENGRKKFGVQIVPLEQVVQNYNGRIYLRRLKCIRDNKFDEKFKKIHSNVHNIKYDTNLSDMMKALRHDNSISNCIDKTEDKLTDNIGQKQTEYWCSALMAYVFTQLNFLPEDCQWTYIIPKQFSTEDTDSKYALNLKNCELGEEILIHDK